MEQDQRKEERPTDGEEKPCPLLRPYPTTDRMGHGSLGERSQQSDRHEPPMNRRTCSVPESGANQHGELKEEQKNGKLRSA
jgi:hypothetical protein